MVAVAYPISAASKFPNRPLPMNTSAARSVAASAPARLARVPARDRELPRRPGMSDTFALRAEATHTHVAIVAPQATTRVRLSERAGGDHRASFAGEPDEVRAASIGEVMQTPRRARMPSGRALA